MNGALAAIVITGAVVLALVSLINTIRDRAMGSFVLVGLGVVELVILIQTALVVVGLIGGEGPADKVTLIGYLATIVIIPPGAAFLGLAERSRWGSGVIVVGAFTVAAMTGRLLQIWQGAA
ncbi:hypothetical protein SAMN05421505_14433 [Sinosporangium album]|uniref:Integral membrane protein n=1 Tax=Sinosporangium album TaxID=504805 RepID=A0A1G8JPC3_9ACTN|nr:hypothetical protein [Sinosporangium album]SDI32933.1 hypothetical protein SAMN05421505_14433 [Sinosporangium album]